MARPTKQGVDYFPLDCVFDDKTEMYLIETGATGLAVLITIWQMIYINQGYFINDNDDLYLLIKRKIDVGINEVSDCVNVCLRRNLFDKSIHKTHKVLTSKAIQKRYFDAAKKKKGVNVCSEYLLIDVNSFRNLVNVDGNQVNVDGNATNVDVDVKEDVNIKEEYCSEPSQDSEPVEPAVIKIPTNKFNKSQEEYSVTQAQVDTWIETFQAVDILQQLKNMRSWSNSNPAKRKTIRGMTRFIDGWLSREQDKGGRYAKNPTSNSLSATDQGGELLGRDDTTW